MTITLEGRLILPMQGNHGENLTAVLTSLQARLADAFGGATITSGLGLWRDPDTGTVQTEDIADFRIAAPDTVENNAVLRDIAYSYGKAAGQKQVYVKTFDGSVHFLPTELEAQSQAA